MIGNSASLRPMFDKLDPLGLDGSSHPVCIDLDALALRLESRNAEWEHPVRVTRHDFSLPIKVALPARYRRKSAMQAARQEWQRRITCAVVDDFAFFELCDAVTKRLTAFGPLTLAAGRVAGAGLVHLAFIVDADGSTGLSTADAARFVDEATMLKIEPSMNQDDSIWDACAELAAIIAECSCGSASATEFSKNGLSAIRLELPCGDSLPAYRRVRQASSNSRSVTSASD